MHLIETTLTSPQENLACDEVLLELCEENLLPESLRLWEPSTYFVVLGYSNPLLDSVHTSPCKERQIPILRRCSGGGTVLQGPGCLNFSLIVKTHPSGPFQSVAGTTRAILSAHRKALQPLLHGRVTIQGYSDLALEGLKFSGNSQRRKRSCVLFHGSFLLDFDIKLMEELLTLPSLQPQYRRNRTHSQFLTNLSLPASNIAKVLQQTWGATKPLDKLPLAHIKECARAKYTTDRWVNKF